MMKKAAVITCVMVAVLASYVAGQGALSAGRAWAAVDGGGNEKAETPAPDSGNTAGAPGPRNYTIDVIALYGLYNRIFWSGNLTQSFDVFTYQLKSDFKRSGDFGYKNSSYYENVIGFTGEADATPKWKITPVVEINNESYGMFRNPFYSREGKDRVSLKLKSEYQPMPTRWTVSLGGVYFNHRFESYLFPDPVAIRPYHASDLYKVNAEVGWQYIWSASNSLSFGSKFVRYFYSTGADYDISTANELVWNFNISEFLKFGLGPLYTYNRDGGHFVSGRINVAAMNIKYFSADASYLYELIPFIPEDLYSGRRYVRPDYGLYPGRGHHADLNLGIDYTRSSEDHFYLKKIRVRASGSFITNDRHYAFFSLPDHVQTHHQMKVRQVRARGEVAIGIAIYSSSLEVGGRYEFNRFFASDYVTYQPEHQAGGYLKLGVWRFEAEFSTSYRHRVRVSPFIDVTMGPAHTGSLSLQFRVLESFFLYGRVDNLYNIRYSSVPGYPEQGRTIIGGLRILI
ncbi:MAG: hypothetical protein JXA07_03145 [Spirochaetes bacterium]|nr:hypothetical protein [Spirochaetota bacterium]